VTVALTYDDGPDPRATPELLSVLERAGVRATFFVRGDRLFEHPEVAREALRRGHRLEPHCFEHRSHHELSRDEIARDVDRVLEALREVVGVDRPQLWRPPYGDIVRPHTYELAAERGLHVVTWTLETCDWAGPSAEEMWGEIVSERRPASALRPDSIVLMHDPIGEETARLTERLVAEIHRRGWNTGPVPADARTPEEPFKRCR
jgi:peptidoglycan/xylan/chitin deacetylase (PgdA/CDA1 family)